MFAASRSRFARLSRSLVSRLCALGFAVLIVLPITEPFQTVSLPELVAPVAHAGAAATPAPLVARTKDTAVSVVPSVDQTEGRLKVESRSVGEKWKSPDFQQSFVQTPVIHTEQPTDQSVGVLRL